MDSIDQAHIFVNNFNAKEIALTYCHNFDMQKFQEGLDYPKETLYAVRYGYLYRKEFEKYENESLHACLGKAPEIIVWIANAIIGGLLYDGIKIAVKKLYNSIVKEGKQIDKTSKEILTDESKLKELYNYILEFHEHRMTATENQIKYIRDEIIADYVGEKACVIVKEKRKPTIEEFKIIIKEANKLAEELIDNNNELD